MNRYKSVDEFLSDQTPEKLAQINYIRRIILGVEPSLVETLKWNAPNYVFRDIDRITFNVMNKEGSVKLIIHMGTSKKEIKKGNPVLPNDHGIVEWNSDIRGTISFKNLNDVIEKEHALSSVLKNWLTIDV